MPANRPGVSIAPGWVLALAVAGYGALAGWLILWPLLVGTPAVALLSVPLLALGPGLWRGSRRAFIYTSVLALLYLALGIMEMAAANTTGYGLGVCLTAMLLFSGAALYARAAPQR